MKKIAFLSLLILPAAAALFAAEPKAELLSEPIHRPIAADADELPRSKKTGDYFNVRSVTDESILVQFGIQRPTDAGITVRLSEGENERLSINAPGRFGRILFSGLTPETDYTVSAVYETPDPAEGLKINDLEGDDALASLTRVCRTLPSPKGELLLKAAFVSDTHVSVIAKPAGRMHFISREILADVCRDAAARGCTLMINGGDVTNESLEEEFEMAKEAMTAFPGTLLMVPGNHDVVKDKEEMKKWRAAFGPTARYETVGGVQFVGLNTADGSLYKPENLDAIEKLDPEKPAVIFSHYQLVKDEILNDSHKAIDDADRCAALLEKIASSKSVIYVGHKNVAALAMLGNVPQFNMPQTTQFPTGWLEAEIRTDGIYHHFVCSTSADRDELSRVLGGCYLGTIGYRDRRTAEIWSRFVPWPEPAEK